MLSNLTRFAEAPGADQVVTVLVAVFGSVGTILSIALVMWLATVVAL